MNALQGLWDDADRRVTVVMCLVIAAGVCVLLVLISWAHLGDIRQSHGARDFAEAAQLTSETAILAQRITLLQYGLLGKGAPDFQQKIVDEIQRELATVGRNIEALENKMRAPPFSEVTRTKARELIALVHSFADTATAMRGPGNERSAAKDLVVSFAQLNTDVVNAGTACRTAMWHDFVGFAVAEDQQSESVFRITVVLAAGFGIFVLAFVAYRVRMELRARRTAEQSLRDAYAELDNFSAIVAHDLNGPLANLLTAAQILEGKVKGSIPVAEEMTGIIRGESQRLHEMVQALLRLCRVTNSRVAHELVAVSDVLDHIRVSLQQKLEESGGSIVHLSGMYLWGDRALLHNLFQNLIENSIKYRQPSVPPEITLSVLRKGRILSIIYEDNGLGIPIQARDQVFNPFYQVPNRAKHPGLGLGLTVVQKILKAHGGRIRIEDKPTDGVRFVLEIPGPSRHSTRQAQAGLAGIEIFHAASGAMHGMAK